MLRLIAIALTLAATPAVAQSVIPCDGWQSSAQNIVEPWEQNSRTFANGKIRVAVLDTIEPAAGAFYLLVLTPPYDELGGRTCAVIAEQVSGNGFAGLDFASLWAEYDPAEGLVLYLPVQRYDPASAEFRSGTISVIINQATGSIKSSVE